MSITISVIPSAVRDYTQFQGKRCALPVLADVYGLYYNKALLQQDPEVAKRLNESELEGLFELAYHLKNVDLIFQRVFGVEATA